MKSASVNKYPVLIFGTTPDYVKRLSNTYPHETLFIVDKCYQGDKYLSDIDKRLLFFTDTDSIHVAVKEVLKKVCDEKIRPTGVACFDCESMVGACELSFSLNLPFPPLGAITKSRNKFESKKIWKKAGISCPQVSTGSNIDETLKFFFKSRDEKIVLKPLAGSGSELTFFCKSREEVENAVDTISSQIKNRKSHPLFRLLPSKDNSNIIDPCSQWVMEDFIDGPEFSCDFILQENKIIILRMTEKIKDNEQTFGTVLAYVMPSAFPPEISMLKLSSVFKKAVNSLGFSWGWFMADFIMKGGESCIIEISPRPGGDSIPDLIETATGSDILQVYLDFISGRIKDITPLPLPVIPYASLNLYLNREGVISQIDIQDTEDIPWAKKIIISCKVGDRVILPPVDYDSRKMGCCIMQMESQDDLDAKREFLREKIIVSISSDRNNKPISKKIAGVAN